MVKREPCRESREEMTEPFVGKKKKSGAYSAWKKGSTSQVHRVFHRVSSLFFVLLLLRIIMRDYFGPFRHPLLFPLL